MSMKTPVPSMTRSMSISFQGSLVGSREETTRIFLPLTLMLPSSTTLTSASNLPRVESYFSRWLACGVGKEGKRRRNAESEGSAGAARLGYCAPGQLSSQGSSQAPALIPAAGSHARKRSACLSPALSHPTPSRCAQPSLVAPSPAHLLDTTGVVDGNDLQEGVLATGLQAAQEVAADAAETWGAGKQQTYVSTYICAVLCHAHACVLARGHTHRPS